MVKHDSEQRPNTITYTSPLTHFFLPGAIVVDYDSFTKREIAKINSALHRIESYIWDCKKEELAGLCEWYDWEIFVYSTNPEATQIGPIGQEARIPLSRLPETCGNDLGKLSDVISSAIDNLLKRYSEVMPHGIPIVRPFILVLSADDFVYDTPPSLFTGIYALNAANKIKVYCATRYGEYPEHVSSYFWDKGWRKPLPLSGIDIQHYLEAHALYSGETWRDGVSITLSGESEPEDITRQPLSASAITLSL